jgi:hypothetical protein
LPFPGASVCPSAVESDRREKAMIANTDSEATGRRVHMGLDGH